MSGVPASEISASASPCLMRARRRGAHLGGVVLMIGDERRLDAVMLEQAARDAGVLGEDRRRRPASVASARNVTSPRLPIGVATMWRPAGSGRAIAFAPRTAKVLSRSALAGAVMTGFCNMARRCIKRLVVVNEAVEVVSVHETPHAGDVVVNILKRIAFGVRKHRSHRQSREGEDGASRLPGR